MTDQRFAERARHDRRRKIKRIALAVLIVTAVGALVWLIWFSSVLAVRSVQVEGLTTLKEAQVLRTADVPEGEPLARVDLAQIEARVSSLERVADVSVSRSWPRTISIDLVERKALVWSRVGQRIRGIDREGIDFRSYGKAPDSLVEAKISVAKPGQRLETTQSVAAVMDLISTKEPSLRKQVRSISAASKDSIEVGLTDDRTIVWGSVARGERKLEVLRSLLGIDAARYDVSAPDQPTTRE